MNHMAAGVQTNKYIKISFRILSKTILLYQLGVRVSFTKFLVYIKGVIFKTNRLKTNVS